MASSSACPLGYSSSSDTAASSCPLGHSAKPSESSSGASSSKPKVVADDAALGTDHQLSRDRVESSIPSVSGENFFYPSEKQFYGSATAKGHDINPSDMSMVIAIHNAVNERTWQDILRYEGLHAAECATPKLLRFLGRPGDISPKARLTGLFGRSPPFDRHDWHVDRCGTQVRYLVDFYDGKQSPTHPVSIHIDARPELSFGGVKDRLRLWAQDLRLF
mmetsp:Transcript_9957/g.26363  ORF Transcript_9957/g.26363 Transcript_9957/m.26363 type:complete len:219 (-) Transcript_9957:98-754(-)